MISWSGPHGRVCSHRDAVHCHNQLWRLMLRNCQVTAMGHLAAGCWPLEAVMSVVLPSRLPEPDRHQVGNLMRLRAPPYDLQVRVYLGAVVNVGAGLAKLCGRTPRVGAARVLLKSVALEATTNMARRQRSRPSSALSCRGSSQG